jgi:hypothetical protein
VVQEFLGYCILEVRVFLEEPTSHVFHVLHEKLSMHTCADGFTMIVDRTIDVLNFPIFQDSASSSSLSCRRQRCDVLYQKK